MSDQDNFSLQYQYNINQTRDMNKVKYKFGDNYRNFRPITRAADYPHWSIFVVTRKKNFNRLPALADNPHPKKGKSLTHTKFLHCFC